MNRRSFLSSLLGAAVAASTRWLPMPEQGNARVRLGIYADPSNGNIYVAPSIYPAGMPVGITPRYSDSPPFVGPHRDHDVCPDCGGVRTCGLMCAKLVEDGQRAIERGDWVSLKGWKRDLGVAP